MLLAGLDASAQIDFDGMLAATADSPPRDRMLEQRIANRIAEYYSRDLFLVHAWADPEEARELNERNMVLPGMPLQLTDDNLPIEPDAARGPRTLLLYLDTSFTPSDVRFVEVLLRGIDSWDQSRGDKVELIPIVFPRKKDWTDWLKELPKSVATPQPAPQQPNYPVYLPSPEKEEPAPAPISAETIPIWQWALLIGGLIILIGIFVLLGMWIQKRSTQELIRLATQPQQRPEVFSLHPEPKTDTVSTAEPVVVNTSGWEPHAARDFVISQTIGEPARTAKILEGWSRQGEEGLKRAAASLAASNDQLLLLMRGKMDTTAETAISQELQPLRTQQKEQFADALIALANALSYQGRDLEPVNHFGFLSQLDDQSLMHLFKEEAPRLVALLIAQLPIDQAKRLLRQFDAPTRSQVLVNLGSISQLPLSLYQEIGQHFARKAMEVRRLQGLPFDGQQVLVQLLENFDEDEQNNIIEHMAISDPQQAETTNKRLVRFSRLRDYPANVLQKAWLEVDTELMVHALAGLDKQIARHVLSTRAKRERDLILSELENEADISPALTSKARKHMLTLLKNYLKEQQWSA